jgi:hypothetical protein
MSAIIRDSGGRELGRILEEGGRTVARDSGGRLLGYYDEATDKTRDEGGRELYKGNMVAALF